MPERFKVVFTMQGAIQVLGFYLYLRFDRKWILTIPLHYIKEYIVPGLQRAGPARHYKHHEENGLLLPRTHVAPP